jgi:tetratricopeptide (TPR) repeat protein
MEQDITTFWANIKKYEDTLAKDPASYCFVQLAELYRKSGLLDDAILVAKKGCEVHPDYVGGFMALGRACFDKGVKDESRTALEKVIAFTPENLLARRLLGQIYADAGETVAAEEALRYILSQNPADPECQALLDSLHSAGHQEVSGREENAPGDYGTEVTTSFDDQFFVLTPEDEEIIEDAEILEELIEEVPPEETEVVTSLSDQSDMENRTLPPFESADETDNESTKEESDPLITVTMAELYASQGFLKRALTIYRGLLETDPENAEWNNRLYELKMAIDEDTEIARHEVTSGAAEDNPSVDSGETPPVAATDEITLTAAAGRSVVETLEQWLETIRRRR